MTPLAPSAFHRPGDDPDLTSDIEWAAAAKAAAATTPGAGLPALTQAMYDERMGWDSAQWETHLTAAINAQPPQARAGIAAWLNKGIAEPFPPEAIAKALGLTMVKIINDDSVAGAPGSMQDLTAPVLTPQPVDGPNILDGARAANATPENARRVAAMLARSQHRHPVTGQFRSPSRGAADVQKSGGLGLFNFTYRNQRGAA